MDNKKHIVSFSGGKDSTAMLLRMIDEGWKIDEIVMIRIMATKELSGEFPEMEKHVQKVNDYCKEKIGLGITFVEHPLGLSFEDYFYKIKQKGKNKGQIYGFPFTIGAWCNSRLKMIPIDNYFNKQGEHIRYVGLAHDEPNRLARLEENEIAPLDIWKMTEDDCLEYIKEKGFYNELYDKFKRLGCWFCPKQNLKSLKVVYDDYPDLWEQMLKWDLDSPVSFRADGRTVHDLDKKFKDMNNNNK